MRRVLKLEMIRAGISRHELAKLLGISYLSLCQKINGERDFKLNECLAIKLILNSELPVEELFMKEVL